MRRCCWSHWPGPNCGRSDRISSPWADGSPRRCACAAWKPRATAELAARVLGSDQLPEELLGRLPSSTGGNPLFVRELVGMLVHDGVLVATAGRLEPDRRRRRHLRPTDDPGTAGVPTGTPELRQPASPRGRLGDRHGLLPRRGRRARRCRRSRHIMSALNRLRRLDLAQPSGAYAGDEPVWRFHHVLIRDVAYRRLLKSERADLHERLANWVHAGGASVAFESDEVIARNLEAAHGYRCDLGLRDGHTGALALRSARSYLASARRALDRDELGSAGSQAARGASLAVADSALQAELLLVGCEAFLSAGDVASGAPLVDDLESIAGQELVAVGDLLSVSARRVHRPRPVARSRRAAEGGHRRVRPAQRSSRACQGAPGAGGSPGSAGPNRRLRNRLVRGLDRRAPRWGPPPDHRGTRRSARTPHSGDRVRRPRRAAGAWMWFGCNA